MKKFEQGDGKGRGMFDEGVWLKLFHYETSRKNPEEFAYVRGGHEF